MVDFLKNLLVMQQQVQSQENLDEQTRKALNEANKVSDLSSKMLSDNIKVQYDAIRQAIIEPICFNVVRKRRVYGKLYTTEWTEKRANAYCNKNAMNVSECADALMKVFDEMYGVLSLVDDEFEMRRFKKISNKSDQFAALCTYFNEVVPGKIEAVVKSSETGKKLTKRQEETARDMYARTSAVFNKNENLSKEDANKLSLIFTQATLERYPDRYVSEQLGLPIPEDVVQKGGSADKVNHKLRISQLRKKLEELEVLFTNEDAVLREEDLSIVRNLRKKVKAWSWKTKLAVGLGVVAVVVGVAMYTYGLNNIIFQISGWIQYFTGVNLNSVFDLAGNKLTVGDVEYDITNIASIKSLVTRKDLKDVLGENEVRYKFLTEIATNTDFKTVSVKTLSGYFTDPTGILKQINVTADSLLSANISSYISKITTSLTTFSYFSGSGLASYLVTLGPWVIYGSVAILLVVLVLTYWKLSRAPVQEIDDSLLQIQKIGEDLKAQTSSISERNTCFPKNSRVEFDECYEFVDVARNPKDIKERCEKNENCQYGLITEMIAAVQKQIRKEDKLIDDVDISTLNRLFIMVDRMVEKKNVSNQRVLKYKKTLEYLKSHELDIVKSVQVSISDVINTQVFRRSISLVGKALYLTFFDGSNLVGIAGTTLAVQNLLGVKNTVYAQTAISAATNLLSFVPASDNLPFVGNLSKYLGFASENVDQASVIELWKPLSSEFLNIVIDWYCTKGTKHEAINENLIKQIEGLKFKSDRKVVDNVEAIRSNDSLAPEVLDSINAVLDKNKEEITRQYRSGVKQAFQSVQKQNMQNLRNLPATKLTRTDAKNLRKNYYNLSENNRTKIRRELAKSGPIRGPKLNEFLKKEDKKIEKIQKDLIEKATMAAIQKTQASSPVKPEIIHTSPSRSVKQQQASPTPTVLLNLSPEKPATPAKKAPAAKVKGEKKPRKPRKAPAAKEEKKPRKPRKVPAAKKQPKDQDSVVKSPK